MDTYNIVLFKNIVSGVMHENNTELYCGDRTVYAVVPVGLLVIEGAMVKRTSSSCQQAGNHRSAVEYEILEQ